MTAAPDLYRLVSAFERTDSPALAYGYAGLIEACLQDDSARELVQERFGPADIPALQVDFSAALSRGLEKIARPYIQGHAVSSHILHDTQTDTVVGEALLIFYMRREGRIAAPVNVIHPALRGRGLGKILMARSIDAAAALGADLYESTILCCNSHSWKRFEPLVRAGLATKHVFAASSYGEDEFVYRVPLARWASSPIPAFSA